MTCPENWSRTTILDARPRASDQTAAMRASFRTLSALLLIVLLTHAAAAGSATASTADSADEVRWSWPLSGPRTVVAPYRAPAHLYGAGHRGVDLGTSIGATVTAPAEGVVAFRGTVVDRPLLTIEHPGGLVTTFEPVASELVAGEVVASGQELGIVDVGGHTPAGALHLGVRLDGDYINPMLLFGDVPRAVLLPCCDGP